MVAVEKVAAEREAAVKVGSAMVEAAMAAVVMVAAERGMPTVAGTAAAAREVAAMAAEA